MKGYKVSDMTRNRKIGIAATSLAMLKTKVANKFQIKDPRIYLAKDGTEVQDEDYFKTLESQTTFIATLKKENIKTDFQMLYEAIRNRFNLIQTGRIIKKFVQTNRQEINEYLSEYQLKKKSQKSETIFSTKLEHPNWFDGQQIAKTCDTKEKVMCRRAQDRIRGYYYKVKDEMFGCDLYKTNKAARIIIDNLLNIFRLILQKVDYFSSYFNRKWENKHALVIQYGISEGDKKNNNDDDETDGSVTPRKKFKKDLEFIFDKNDKINELCVSLCNDLGEFPCQGLWNCDQCSYIDDHVINPYQSREQAILFQIWNLDHKIEISRSIIPSMLKNIQTLADLSATSAGRKDDNSNNDDFICKTHHRPGKMISIMKYFYEIFTIENLKFVHIICHDKGLHRLQSEGGILCEKCDEYQFLQELNKTILKYE